MGNEIRVIIADDHPVVRRGLRQMVEADPKLKVVGEAADGEAALAQIQELKPAIAVVDVDMPRLDGLGVAREIRKRRLPVEVVFLTIHGEEDVFHAAMDLGSKGYLLKDSAATEIVQALRAVAEGNYYVTPSLAAHLVQRRSRTREFAERTGLGDLTPTERRILRMVAEGKSSKSMAEELFIHYRTVENHRTNICQKLGLQGHNALFKFALQNKSEL
ncbi:MAG TPA: response regulator transcription factor [Terriglobia bacterium]|nr:response regulator transcription factor [Terriglobia bacterium]